MKQKLIKTIKPLLSDRWIVGLVVANLVVVIISVLVIIFTIEPRDTQVITRFTSFGITGFYPSYWYSLYLFALFQLIVVIGHIFIGFKLINLDRRGLALVLYWLTIGLSVVTLMIAMSIIKIAALG